MSFVNTGTALVCWTALLFAAAGASAQVVNDVFEIVDDDDSDISAVLTANDDTFAVDLTVTCTSGGETAIFEASTNHPDSVKVSSKKARVKQGNKDNPIGAMDVEGIGTLNFTGTVSDCNSAKLDASVSTGKVPSTGKFKLHMKACDTDLTLPQLDFIAVACAATRDREFRGIYDETPSIRSLKITGKGEAFVVRP
jgi:hypothetical protein